MIRASCYSREIKGGKEAPEVNVNKQGARLPLNREQEGSPAFSDPFVYLPIITAYQTLSSFLLKFTLNQDTNQNILQNTSSAVDNS